MIEDLTDSKELDNEAMAIIRGGNPLVPAAAAALGIGFVAGGAYLVYKAGEHVGWW